MKETPILSRLRLSDELCSANNKVNKIKNLLCPHTMYQDRQTYRANTRGPGEPKNIRIHCNLGAIFVQS